MDRDRYLSDRQMDALRVLTADREWRRCTTKSEARTWSSLVHRGLAERSYSGGHSYYRGHAVDLTRAEKVKGVWRLP